MIDLMKTVFAATNEYKMRYGKRPVLFINKPFYNYLVADRDFRDFRDFRDSFYVDRGNMSLCSYCVKIVFDDSDEMHFGLENRNLFMERRTNYEIQKYAKVVTKEFLCAIYEPHPFRSDAISEAVGFSINTGIPDDEWTWVYYDWCCNPVGISDEKPDGVEVDKFTTDNLDFSYTTPECAQNPVDYLNMEPYGEED